MTIAADLRCGAMLIVSSLPNRPGSLGYYFLTSNDGRLEQRLLIVRLAYPARRPVPHAGTSEIGRTEASPEHEFALIFADSAGPLVPTLRVGTQLPRRSALAGRPGHRDGRRRFPCGAWEPGKIQGRQCNCHPSELNVPLSLPNRLPHGFQLAGRAEHRVLVNDVVGIRGHEDLSGRTKVEIGRACHGTSRGESRTRPVGRRCRCSPCRRPASPPGRY